MATEVISQAPTLAGAWGAWIVWETGMRSPLRVELVRRRGDRHLVVVDPPLRCPEQDIRAALAYVARMLAEGPDDD